MSSPHISLFYTFVKRNLLEIYIFELHFLLIHFFQNFREDLISRIQAKFAKIAKINPREN